MKKVTRLFVMLILILSIIDFGQKDMLVKADSSDTVELDQPPFAYYIADDVKDSKNNAIELKLKSSKANKIIDEDEWFINNKLSLNTIEVPNSFRNIKGHIPEGIDATWNKLMITKAFYDSSYIYCTYGSNFAEGYILNIYDANTLELVYSLDFSNYRYSPKYIKADYDYIQQQIYWAVIKDDILYVSHAHNTYAKSSKNMNAYITAIDLKNMSILWRTKALVCNSYNFVIVDDVIVCGYGFTDEHDYLYQIDMNNGKVLSKTALKTAPSYIIKKGNTLYVRTYNTDYRFSITKK